MSSMDSSKALLQEFEAGKSDLAQFFLQAKTQHNQKAAGFVASFHVSSIICEEEAEHLKQNNIKLFDPEELIDNMVKVWEREIQYEKAYASIKDTIFEKYSIVISKQEEVEIIKKFELERDDIVLNLLIESELENKTRLSKFCKKLLSGFEASALKNMSTIVTYVFQDSNFWETTLLDKILRELDQITLAEDISKIKDIISILNTKQSEAAAKTINLFDVSSTLQNATDEKYSVLIECNPKNSPNEDVFQSNLEALISEKGLLTIESLEVNINCIQKPDNRFLKIFELKNQKIPCSRLSAILYKDHTFRAFQAIGLKKLQILSLTLHKFCKVKIPLLDRLLMETFNLLELSISFPFFGRNEINDETFSHIVNIIKRNKSLIKLFLDVKNALYETYYITDRGVIQLANALRKCLKIKELTLKLDNNKIGNDGLNAIKTLISDKLPKIQLLDINLMKNLCKEDSVLSFCETVLQLTYLHTLALNFTFQSIPTSLKTKVMKMVPKREPLLSISIQVQMFKQVDQLHMANIIILSMADKQNFNFLLLAYNIMSKKKFIETSLHTQGHTFQQQPGN